MGNVGSLVFMGRVLGGQFIHLNYGADQERDETISIDGEIERSSCW